MRWIQKAIKKPGALRKRLEGMGLVKKGKKIPVAVLREAASGAFGPKTAIRARLAIKLRSLRK